MTDIAMSMAQEQIRELRSDNEMLRTIAWELLGVAERLRPAEHSLAQAQIDKARRALEQKP